MTAPSLLGLPAFLRFLTTYPAPRAAVSALRTTALATFGAQTCSVWTILDEDLVIVATDGHTPEETDRYGVLPHALDLIMWRAVRSGVPVITEENTVAPTGFSNVDEEFWARTVARVGAVGVVRAPILYSGAPVGALGLLLDKPWPDTDQARALLATVCDVLGLWLTSPESGALEAAEANRSRATTLRVAFTERQREILRLVEQDASTPQIATTLRMSESTVKQDLQQVMRALNTRSRAIAAARARELGLL